MITRELVTGDKQAYNQLTNHPLQSWKWGEFRQKLGTQVIRIGTFSGKNLVSGFQIFIHQIPHFPYTVGYFPKGQLPDTQLLVDLKKIADTYNCIFIQLEPNVVKDKSLATDIMRQLRPSAKPLFTKYTFYIDLTKTEAEMLQNFHPKTRYNIRLAQKYGVTVQEENTPEAFTKYLELTRETTKRQGFFAHDENYHQVMWNTLHEANIAHLFTARWQKQILVTWLLFHFQNKIYYPYGASSSLYKEVMASNLMMWEVIRWGKNKGAEIFDLWGTPGPNPAPQDPHYGFHKFKLGYNPQLIEFVGSFDLVLKKPHYQLFTLANRLRWIGLKLIHQIFT